MEVRLENANIHRFNVRFEGRWSPANETFPIVNSEGQLVGSFLIIEGPIWKCFLSGVGYPESLFLGSSSPPFITPVESVGGAVEKLMVSTYAVNEESQPIREEECEEQHA